MPEPKVYASIDEFRSAHGDERKADKFAGTEGGAEAKVLISPDAEVKVGSGDSRTLTFTISTATVDRAGDTIAVEGWKLENYRKNPVVLWGHDSADFPVAKATKVWIEDGKLMATADFVPKENPATGLHAEGILQLYKGGFLSAVSVGFSPLKYAFTDDPQRRYGIDFIEQELLEYSLVTVPANAEALIQGRAAGIDVTAILAHAERVLRDGADTDRVICLAEDILKRDNGALLQWAERVLKANGQAIMSQERVSRIERAATAQRLAKARARDLDLIEIRGK